MTDYTKATCRGSYALATACGNCERCAEERAKLDTIQPGTNAAHIMPVPAGAVSDFPRSEVSYVTEQEAMSIYRFDDGSVLKTKLVLMHVERIEGAYNPDGSPMYNLSWHQAMSILVSPEMRRKG